MRKRGVKFSRQSGIRAAPPAPRSGRQRGQSGRRRGRARSTWSRRRPEERSSWGRREPRPRGRRSEQAVTEREREVRGCRGCEVDEETTWRIARK